MNRNMNYYAVRHTGFAVGARSTHRLDRIDEVVILDSIHVEGSHGFGQ